MKTLNLINLEQSDIKYHIINFPDGEPHIVFEEIDRKECQLIDVKCRICNPSDLFILMQIKDIFDRQGIGIDELYITYLMSMRMDRVISFNQAYSLKIVTDVINSLNAYSVKILEEHSKTTHNLIENGYNIDRSIAQSSEIIKVFPDKGAFERAHISSSILFVKCEKTRNLKTGELLDFNIINKDVVENNKDKHFMIVDDLCDGGGTFVGIANKLREINPDIKLSIYVTHMVNPKGIQTLSDNFYKVWFTDSYKDWNKEELPNNVTVLEI